MAIGRVKQMKAPDKIYICIERTYDASDGQVIAMVTPHNERQSVNDIEYICKDALLEWIEEIRAIPHDGAMWRDKAFQEVVNHLNTM